MEHTDSRGSVAMDEKRELKPNNWFLNDKYLRELLKAINYYPLRLSPLRRNKFNINLENDELFGLKATYNDKTLFEHIFGSNSDFKTEMEKLKTYTNDELEKIRPEILLVYLKYVNQLLLDYYDEFVHGEEQNEKKRKVVRFLNHCGRFNFPNFTEEYSNLNTYFNYIFRDIIYIVSSYHKCNVLTNCLGVNIAKKLKKPIKNNAIKSHKNNPYLLPFEKFLDLF